MKGIRVGFALCGSFCSFERVISLMERLVGEGAEIVPIMSFNAASIDTRFGKAKDFTKRIELISGRRIISTIEDAEPIGPKGLCDVMLVAPCTGNTLAKLAHGITDSAVTMAAKAHLRNGRPLIIALSTNDGLSGSAENIGRLLNRKNVYFVPFGQDDPEKKPCSLQADFTLAGAAVSAALEGRQLQPLLK